MGESVGANDPTPDIPGYRVESVLGRGAFGIVLCATATDGRRVALKLATPNDAVAAAQLAREEKALRTLGSGIGPAVFEYAALATGGTYIALELLEPPTLSQRLREVAGPLDISEWSAIAFALCDAVTTVHSAGLIHLDLKPDNVFLRPNGVRLIDFGLSRCSSERPIGEPSFAGTPEYASPEQCEERADLDLRADIYALGAMFFEILAGRPPFLGDAQAVRRAHIAVRPPRPSQFAPVQNAIEDVVLRALAKDRMRRHQTVTELKMALQSAILKIGTAGSPTRVAGQREFNLDQRQVGLVMFAHQAAIGSIQNTVRALGGEIGWTGRGRCAAVFASEQGQNPARLAWRAAQRLATEKLAIRSIVDCPVITVQRRGDGQLRYFARELAAETRYATDSDPVGVLATSTAAAILTEVEWEPIPGRPDLLVARHRAIERLSSATILQLGAGALVGRDEVLRELLASAKGTIDHVPSVVTVIADPGHGKTHLAATLVEKLRSHLPTADVLDIRARDPIPGDAEDTLRALFVRALELAPDAREEVLRAQFFASLDSNLASELWPAAALTLRFVSSDQPRVRELAAAPGVLRSMAMRAVGEVLRSRARRQPLCVVLDDAQNADDVALDALEYAALAEARVPLYVCVLARPSFAQARKSFGERAAARATLHLGALEDEPAAELCRRLLAPAENVPHAAINVLVQRAQGVPLLLVELIRGLKRDGLVRRRLRSETWYLATDELDKLPNLPILEWLASREMDAMPIELAMHARLAAQLGVEFTIDELEGVINELQVVGADTAFPLDAQVGLARLCALGMLLTTRTGGYRFRHALVRDAIAESLPSDQQSVVHKAAAQFYRLTRAISEVRRIPLLARHAACAGLKEEAATLYLELAADARKRHAYLDAERSYTCSLDCLSHADVRSHLLAQHGRGSTRYRIGRYEDAFADFSEACRLARVLGDRNWEADILLDASTALDWINEFERSGQLVREAEALCDRECSEAMRVRLLLAQARTSCRSGERAEACRMLQLAAQRAEILGDDGYETLIIALVMLTAVMAQLGRINEAEATSARVMELARDRGDRLHVAAALNNRRNILIGRKDAKRACEEQAAFMQIGRELGVVTTEYIGEYNLAELLYYTDDTDSAMEHARRALEIASRRAEVASHRPAAVLLMARIEAYRGEVESARKLLQEAASLVAGLPHGDRVEGTLTTRGEQLLVSVVDFVTRDATTQEWEQALMRSEIDCVEQEPIEVADLYGRWALRRGRIAEARRAFEEAARRAARIPNIMDARIQKGLAATGGPLT